MNLMDLLQQAGGDDSVAAMAGTIGINRDEANRVVGALAPALTRSLQNQAKDALSKKSAKAEGDVSRNQLGGLLGGMLDADDDGFGVDDALNLARRFF